MRISIKALAMAALAAVACNSVDPDYTYFNTVTLENETGTVTGIVTAVDGTGLGGVTVTLREGQSTKTASDGSFSFTGVSRGTFNATAEAEGYSSGSATISIEDTKDFNHPLNFRLVNNANKLEVKAGDEGSFSTEAASQSASVAVSAKIPSDALPSGTSLVITPKYSFQSASKAENLACTLVELEISRSDGQSSSLGAESVITLAIAESVAEGMVFYYGGRQLSEGTDYTIDGSKVSFNIKELGTLTGSLGVSVETSTSSDSMTIVDPAEVDNQYGQNVLIISEVVCKYKTGAEVTSREGSDEAIQSMLENLFFNLCNTSGMKEIDAACSCEITVPVSYYAWISGSQSNEKYTLSYGGATVRGVQYGTASVSVAFSGRHHSGGSSE